jgi:hypothetical protein
MYSLDSQGFRIEYVPQTSLDGITVARRASSPLVIYFYRTERPDETMPFDFMDLYEFEYDYPLDYDSMNLLDDPFGDLLDFSTAIE